jgi:hypothetical protein
MPSLRLQSKITEHFLPFLSALHGCLPHLQPLLCILADVMLGANYVARKAHESIQGILVGSQLHFCALCSATNQVTRLSDINACPILLPAGERHP